MPIQRVCLRVFALNLCLSGVSNEHCSPPGIHLGIWSLPYAYISVDHYLSTWSPFGGQAIDQLPGKRYFWDRSGLLADRALVNVSSVELSQKANFLCFVCTAASPATDCEFLNIFTCLLSRHYMIFSDREQIFKITKRYRNCISG